MLAGAAGLAPSFNILAPPSFGDEETRYCGMTKLTQRWGSLGNEFNSRVFFRFLVSRPSSLLQLP